MTFVHVLSMYRTRNINQAQDSHSLKPTIFGERFPGLGNAENSGIQ